MRKSGGVPIDIKEPNGKVTIAKYIMIDKENWTQNM